MSWLLGSLQPDDPHDEAKQPQSPSSSRVPNDLSFLRQTLGRQLRGVASFLVPPPPSSSPSHDAVPSSNSQPQPPSQSQLQSQSQALLGIRNDLVEIGGSFKSGLSLLSTNSNKAVTEISKFASNLLQLQNEALEDDDDDDDDDCSVPGITDDVIGFVTEISVLPNYWTDFPIPVDHDFSMSNAQREHASTVERLVPGFADLRTRLGSSISEKRFWMIYFLLLLPRLNEHDFQLLSTPKIVEARDVLLHKLQNKRNTQVDSCEKSILDSPKKDIQVGKAQGVEISSQENEALTEIVNTAGRLKIDDEESTEQWSEEASISSGTFVDGQRKHETEEDISFSDLEDDENDLSSSTRLSGLRRGRDVRACSPNGSNDWVQLNRSSEIEGGQRKAGQSKERDSEGEDSNDWLTVDGFD
ncbi:hypothetical protein L3X38_040354 [Prunus dulcis]|uniref:BSD domain-containing protein n=1 Tax=Prunus dulcis TaxID=3755 RepID=A0AAD4YTB3_PRUDU|nr:hypothetical protein L3X38_040354 [Prunus dulcis]